MTPRRLCRHLAIATLVARVGAQGYPECVERDVVFRHAGAHAIFVNISAHGDQGCWQNDCKHTDKFNSANEGTCGRVCASLAECTHWSFGEQDGATKCFLRKSDGGRDEVAGWVSGSRDCVASPLPPALLSLATAQSESLVACDGGRSERCPDLERAVQTWKFAIDQLQEAVRGQVDESTMQWVNVITDDTHALSTQGVTDEGYEIVSSNNRQVFSIMRGWLESHGTIEFSPDDTTLPNPLRGELCGRSSCFEL